MNLLYHLFNVGKRSVKQLMMLFSFAVPALFSAQLYPVAGTCTNTTSSTYGPMYSTSSANATNRTAVIYPASQLAGISSQVLNAIYFWKGSTANLAGTPNLKVYLKETSNLDFGSGALDWASESTGAALVYDGNPAAATTGAAGWKQIAFTTNFTYSGSQNLMVLFEYVNTGNTTAVTWQYEYVSPCVVTSNSNTTKYINNTTGTLGTSLTSSEYRRPRIAFDYIATCPATNVPTTPTIGTNSATITWVPTGSESNWDYAVVPSGSGLPTTWTTVGVTTVMPALNPQTQYDFYVRANCGGGSGVSGWQSVTFKTLCVPVTSLFENFDSYATGNIVPDCWARIVGSSNTAQTISSTTPASGTRNLYQITSSAANTTIAVLPEFSNVNAGTHWLRFKARVTAAPGSLDIGYVTNITDASTFVNIQTITINNTSYSAQDSEYMVVVPSTVPSNARLAIRNAGTSTAGHFIDDLYWEAKPSCIMPTGITISNPTYNSATVSWSASVTPPANGYDVYYSTSEVMPLPTATPNLTGITGLSTQIGPLNPSSIYYVWVRARCSASDLSAWSTQITSFITPCQPPAIINTVGASVCPGASATLSATADAGATITWYDAATAGNVVATGSSFTTPAINAPTDYYVSASVGSTENVGVANPGVLTNSGTTSAGTTFYMEATVANAPTLVQSVDVFPNAAGTASFIRVYLGTATTPVYEIPFTSNVASGGVTPQTIPLNILLNPGTYRFKIEGAGSYYRNYSSPGGVGQSFPYGVGNFTLTGGSNVTTGYYLFYNFVVSSKCESLRTLVTAAIDSGCLSTVETEGKNKLKVYPNPFTDVIYINEADKVQNIKISDMSGKILRNIDNPVSEIRLTELSSGMYIVLLEMKNGAKQTLKVVKK